MFKLAMVPGKGRGLLAERPIAAGSCLERAPAVRLGAGDRALLDQTAFFAYYFAEPRHFGSRSAHDALVVFGRLTFCNHSESPNAVVHWEEDRDGLWAVLEAIADIAIGEEITLFYTNISEYSASDLFI
ncbi:SET domain-containing protein-lysine N-methyltransferase [Pelagibius sp. CAU 1746]|uniref:SET domain-containing protein-lysine N-methyltransferase n=1 Tax=Pelagibius sp. CAU 1746 TaxID=3140370 RepID=UPI00325AB153